MITGTYLKFYAGNMQNRVTIRSDSNTFVIQVTHYMSADFRFDPSPVLLCTAAAHMALHTVNRTQQKLQPIHLSSMM